MMKINIHSIKTRFTIVSALVIILSAALVTEQHHTSSVQERQTTKLALISKVVQQHMESDMMHDAIRADVLAALLAKSNNDTGGIEQAEQDLTEHYQTLMTNMEANRKESLPEDLAKALNEVQVKLVAYGEAASDVIDMAKANENSAKVQQGFKKAFSRLEEDMSTISDGIEGWSGVEMDISAAQSERNKTIVMILTAMTMLLVIFLPFYARMSIFTPQKKLADSIDAMARGELVEVGGIEMNNEIGEMARSVKSISDQGQHLLRVKTALDVVRSNVMMADTTNTIVYANQSVQAMLKHAQADIRKDLPNFDADKLMGVNIDSFHKNPAHQQGMLKNLTKAYETTIRVGGRTFDLIATPVFDAKGVRVGVVVEWKDVTLELKVEEEVNNVVQAASAGDFKQRLSLEGKAGFMLNLSKGINQIGEVADSGLSETVEVLNSLSEGDLSRRIEGEYQGIFDDIKQSVNGTINKLADMVNRIKEAASSVNSASGEISAGSKDLSARTEQQASTLEETAASMEQITGAVRQNTENANNANNLADEAKNVAEKGGMVAKDAVKAMESIEKSSQKISDIIGVIDDIAFQTNLLALNAAVEAARAGDAGKGFAVVASEVRSLAGRSASASKEIKSLINESAGQVESGAQLVKQAGETLDGIVKSVNHVAELMAEIASASAEQSSGIEEINSAVAQMDEATQQNAALVEENTAAAQSLVNQARDLDELMRFFRLSEEDEASDSFGGRAPVALIEGAKRASAKSASAAKKPVVSPAKPTAAPKKALPAKKGSVTSSYDEGWEEF